MGSKILKFIKTIIMLFFIGILAIIGFIIYDEIKGGRFKYKEKEYDSLLDENGEYEEKIKPECKQCTNNQYYKEEKNTNKYTIEKEEFEKLKTDVKKILDNVEKLFEIFGK